jgi:hypothetical protein
MWLRRRHRIVRRLALGFAVAAIAAPAAQGRIAAEPSPSDQWQVPAIVLGQGYAPDHLQPQPPEPVVVASEPAGGFDWRDAGIGVAFAFGLIALAVAGALARRGGGLARA